MLYTKKTVRSELLEEKKDGKSLYPPASTLIASSPSSFSNFVISFSTPTRTYSLRYSAKRMDAVLYLCARIK